MKQIYLKTLYIGGGTPSLCPDNLLLDMSGRIKSVFNIDCLNEVTIECNPQSVTREKLVFWRRMGINRLSIGVQSSDAAALASVGRHQTIEDVRQIMDYAEPVFENISVDIMLGLPGLKKDQWQEFILELITWPIKHISLYCLMIYDPTPLAFKLRNKSLTLPDESLVADLYSWSVEQLKINGFLQYEVSNFARPGYESEHNLAYWTLKPYKGFGIGACSYDGRKRYMNEQNLMHYIMCIEQGNDPVMYDECLNPGQIRMETLMLSLRRTAGLQYNYLMEGLSDKEQNTIKEKVVAMDKAGLLRIEDGYIKLTTAGFVVEQEIITQLV